MLDQKIAVENYSGGTADPLLYMWPEPNGTIHQITQAGAVPTVLETRITSAWGEPLSMTDLGLAAQPAPFTEFGYTGRRNLGDTGLMDYRARFYDPKLGRFLNPDPSGTKAGLNRYGCASGDPVNRFDPFGLTDSPGIGPSGMSGLLDEEVDPYATNVWRSDRSPLLVGTGNFFLAIPGSIVTGSVQLADTTLTFFGGNEKSSAALDQAQDKMLMDRRDRTVHRVARCSPCAKSESSSPRWTPPSRLACATAQWWSCSTRRECAAPS